MHKTGKSRPTKKGTIDNALEQLGGINSDAPTFVSNDLVLYVPQQRAAKEARNHQHQRPVNKKRNGPGFVPLPRPAGVKALPGIDIVDAPLGHVVNPDFVHIDLFGGGNRDDEEEKDGAGDVDAPVIPPNVPNLREVVEPVNNADVPLLIAEPDGDAPKEVVLSNKLLPTLRTPFVPPWFDHFCVVIAFLYWLWTQLLYVRVFLHPYDMILTVMLLLSLYIGNLYLNPTRVYWCFIICLTILWAGDIYRVAFDPSYAVALVVHAIVFYTHRPLYNKVYYVCVRWWSIWFPPDINSVCDMDDVIPLSKERTDLNTHSYAHTKFCYADAVCIELTELMVREFWTSDAAVIGTAHRMGHAAKERATKFVTPAGPLSDRVVNESVKLALHRLRSLQVSLMVDTGVVRRPTVSPFG